MCSKKTFAILVAVIGVILLGVGITLLSAENALLQLVLKQVLPLTSSGSRLYDAFVDPDSQGVTFVRRFTMFNVTNSADICNGAAPNIVAVGPYTYHQRPKKSNLSWSGDKNFLDYKYDVDFVFDPTLSIDERTGQQLSKDDQIMFYSVPFYSSAYRTATMDPNLLPPPEMNNPTPIQVQSANILNMFVTNCVTTDDTGNNPVGILQTFSVQQYLFGYTDPLLSTLQKTVVANNITYYDTTVSRMQFRHGLPAPSPISPDYGQQCPMNDNIFTQCNTTNTSATQIMTGNDDLSNIGKMTQWAGQKDGELMWWGEGCRSFNGGTDGTMYKPGLNKKENPTIFVDAIWRPVQLEFDQESSVRGIDTYVYRLSNSTLQSKQDNPANGCYNMDLQGFLNLSSALYAPVVITKALYLDADSKGRLNFTLNHTAPVSNREDDWYFEIEPITGAPMKISVKIQMSLQVGPRATNVNYTSPFTGKFPAYYSITQNLAQTYIPFYIAENYFELGSKLADQFKNSVGLFQKIAKIGGIIGTALGTMLALGGFMWWRKTSKDEYNGEYLPVNNSGFSPVKDYSGRSV